MGEVAVAQVQQQFFDGILNLNPGMVPGIGLIEPFQIGLMLCYLLRMAEGEGELMSLHREDTAQSMRCGFQIRREVSGVCHQSDVADLVLLRHDGHRVMQEHVSPIDRLEIFLATLTVIVEHLKHIIAQMTLLGYSFQFLTFLGIAHETIGGIPTLSYPSPRGPSPDAEGSREEITVLTIGCHLVDVKA